jgi:hypothetical protein
MDYIISRLSESSTWRGLVLLVTALGVQLSPDLQAAIVSSGLALVGLINVVRTEKKK